MNYVKKRCNVGTVTGNIQFQWSAAGQRITRLVQAYWGCCLQSTASTILSAWQLIDLPAGVEYQQYRRCRNL